jgi:DNA-binding NarL/FixJ family response regulator
MNHISAAPKPFLALVDDDPHSARLLTRMLFAHGSPEIVGYASASEAAAKLGVMLSDPHFPLPGIVIVDLKSSSSASTDFIAGLTRLKRGTELLVAAIASSPDKERRDALLEAGAAAVFERHADIEAYREEAASIVSFWVRNQHLNAIGT